MPVLPNVWAHFSLTIRLRTTQLTCVYNTDFNKLHNVIVQCTCVVYAHNLAVFFSLSFFLLFSSASVYVLCCGGFETEQAFYAHTSSYNMFVIIVLRIEWAVSVVCSLSAAPAANFPIVSFFFLLFRSIFLLYSVHRVTGWLLVWCIFVDECMCMASDVWLAWP